MSKEIKSLNHNFLLQSTNVTDKIASLDIKKGSKYSKNRENSSSYSYKVSKGTPKPRKRSSSKKNDVYSNSTSSQKMNILYNLKSQGKP
jgi:hypothetical protein